jgi:hypothetical protein
MAVNKTQKSDTLDDSDEQKGACKGATARTVQMSRCPSEPQKVERIDAGMKLFF